MNFEKFGKKIVAKTHEVLETKKAKDTMTPEQRYATGQRERYHKAKRDEGFNGEVLKSHIGYPTEEDIRTDREQLVYEAEINGHTVSGSFYFRITWGKVRIESEDMATIIVDGKPLSKDAALLFARKYRETLRRRAFDIRDGGDAVGSVQRANEWANRPQKSNEELDEEEKQREIEYTDKQKTREALAEQTREELDQALG